ncbi:MAG: hypothetical protein HKM02_04405 [Pseudomonadales bacterium]|nr:hypothetical protein [Pseudomonadales bacterium]
MLRVFRLHRVLLTIFLLFTSIWSSAVSPQAPAAYVLHFSPQGTVSGARQVSATFTTDMVRLGDPSVRNPFIIQCIAAGHGRWLDARHWVYDFAHEVPLFRTCTFTLVPGVHDLTGLLLNGTRHFEFSTSTTVTHPSTHQGQIVLEYFVPQGTAPSIRQVQTRFSEDMIRLGDPHVFNPFVVRCSQPGQGRWLDTRNWVYDFDHDMPGGITCSFHLVDHLHGISGKSVVSAADYAFNTGGPQLIDMRPITGQENIDENQVFLLKMNSKLDLVSLATSVYCLEGDLKERIPVHFFDIKQTRNFIAQLPKNYQDWWAATGPAEERRVLQCTRTFIPGNKVALVLASGLRSAQGVRTPLEQRLTFQVRPRFTATFNCRRENARKPCLPISDMQLSFSEFVTPDLLRSIRLEAGNRTWTPQPNAPSKAPGGEGQFIAGRTLTFAGPFPAQSHMILRLPPHFIDETGRVLENQASYPLSVTTAAYPPLAKFSADFGIIEKDSSSVPLTVRNLDDVSQGVSGQARIYTFRVPDQDSALLDWWHRFQKHQQAQNCYMCTERDKQGHRKSPDPRSIALIAHNYVNQSRPLPRQLSSRDFEVIGLPAPGPGVYIHEVESSYLGSSLLDDTPGPMYVAAMNVVTNLGVHLVTGPVSSLVWVTSLDQGIPQAGVDLALYTCQSSAPWWTGVTDQNGIARFQGTPPLERCQSNSFAVIAHQGQDRSLVFSSWDRGIESWRFNLPGNQSTGSLIAHTVLDRSLLRAGETLHMRHIIRMTTLAGLNEPKGVIYKRLVIRHDGSGDEYDLSLNIDADGNGNNDWKIPVAAKLGSYRINLETQDNSYTLANFAVEEFRLPALKASLQLPQGPLVQAPTLPVNMQLSFLNGGGYARANVILRGRVTPDPTDFAAYPDYSFDDPLSNAQTNAPNINSLDDVSQNDDEDSADATNTISTATETQDIPLAQRQIVLDAQGGARLNAFPLPAVHRVSALELELEYRDPSGEVNTTYAQTSLWPAAVVPGIKPPSWLDMDGNKPQRIDIITLGINGQPHPHTPVVLSAEMVSQETHRRRTVGGFYAYETVEKRNAVPLHCDGRTNDQGKLSCWITPSASGNLLLRVTATDEAGRSQTASSSVWINAGERWWFNQANDDRIDLLPEKKEYASGETMRFQVRMPFPEATALITMSRDGILETQVRHLSSTHPILELPVKPEYAPNVFVSVLLVRGRNTAVAPTALIDLGKPAFKLGVAAIKVDWAPWRLGVSVQTDKIRYQPRDNAQVTVHVTPPLGQPLPPETTITLSAVDEALLELAQNDSEDVLTPMMQERNFGMLTATSQSQVVGKRHFGMKALPPGGGGGGRGASTRELFNTLLYWQACAHIDAQGNAHFVVPINDSLTSFKLVATAISKDHFGGGSSRIENATDLQIISGLPLIVRQGDRLDPGFTLRNDTPKSMAVNFSASVSGLGQLVERQINLPAGGAEVVTVPLTVPKDIQELHWELHADATNSHDSLRLTEKVLDPVPEQVFQSTLTQLSAPWSLAVEKPQEALQGGALQISAKAHLADGLDGVRNYLQIYPYRCMEQRVSIALGTGNRAMWDEAMGLLPAYLDPDGLVTFWPVSALPSGSLFLTNHLLQLSYYSGWPIPEALRERMLSALTNYAQGKTSYNFPYHTLLDDDYRRLEVSSTLALYGRFQASYLEGMHKDPTQWDASMLVNWMQLLRHAQYMPRQEALLDHAQNLLRAHLIRQGTILVLDNRHFNWWWLFTDNSTTMAKLMLQTLDLPAWKEDQPLLLHGLLSSQNRGSWDTTVANVWGSLAVQAFGNAFEHEPVTGHTLISLGTQSNSLDWSTQQPGTVRMNWPAGPGTLNLTQQGGGQPWITVQARARWPIMAPMNSGFSVAKKLIPLQQRTPGHWSAGDVVEVCLRLQSESPMDWVALNDPIPAGATLLGRTMSRDTTLASYQSCSWPSDPVDRTWIWPDYEEHAADAYRAYFSAVSTGTWEVVYVIRLNQSGEFLTPATRLEAMYAPEMFGMTPNATWEIEP